MVFQMGFYIVEFMMRFTIMIRYCCCNSVNCFVNHIHRYHYRHYHSHSLDNYAIISADNINYTLGCY